MSALNNNAQGRFYRNFTNLEWFSGVFGNFHLIAIGFRDNDGKSTDEIDCCRLNAVVFK